MTAPGPDDAPGLERLAGEALDRREEAAAEPLLAAYLARHPDDARMLQWRALLLRGLDRREEALAALRRAHGSAPGDAGIAQALAQVSLEAGLPASRLFEIAIQLAPANADLRLGLAAARLAQGEGARALAELDAMLAANPGWYQGHRQYAQLAAQAGHPEAAFATLERALEAYPASEDLHLTVVALHAEAEQHEAVLETVSRAIAQFGEAELLLLYRAAALDERGERGAAADLFERLGPAEAPAHAVLRLRHLLRRGAFAQAGDEIEPWLTRDEAETLWPYAALTWRLARDPRAAWLEGQAGLTAEIDLSPADFDQAGLLDLLRGLHAKAGRFLDQSVRHGTQTDGQVLARIEPPIARLRERLREQVARFAQRLPPGDASHPLLCHRRDRTPRFAGSWSVRLTEGGYHASHQHPQGWLSAVFYAAVPERLAPGEGMLELGASPGDLDLGLAALSKVEPKPGRLAIFPSYMWHGTTRFSEGERITIAFDIARP